MMKKLTHLVLMLCLTLSGAWCYAHGAAGTENGKGKDGTPIDIIESTSLAGLDKSNTIVSSIDGHVLTVQFNENIGEVTIEITTASGNSVHYLWTPTPNGYQTYISQSGDYIITFTLSNGDEYYGEFTVTD